MSNSAASTPSEALKHVQFFGAPVTKFPRKLEIARPTLHFSSQKLRIDHSIGQAHSGSRL